MADYVIVALFGLGIGLGELVSRYRDAPLRAVGSAPALLYMVVNACAALGALALIRVFEVDFGIGVEKVEQVRWTQLFVAGFASMALFRSSLFTVRVGDQDIGIGPSSFLQLVLQAADRGVDRVRAEARASEVLRAMDGVSFAKSYAALPVLCLELMQNLPAEDQAALGEEIKKLAEAEIDDGIKTLILGLKLMNLVGQGVLLGAVESIAPRIRAADRIELSPEAEVMIRLGHIHQIRPRVLDRLQREIAPTGITWTTDDASVLSVLDRCGPADVAAVMVSPPRRFVGRRLDPVGGSRDDPGAQRVSGSDLADSIEPNRQGHAGEYTERPRQRPLHREQVPGRLRQPSPQRRRCSPSGRLACESSQPRCSASMRVS